MNSFASEESGKVIIHKMIEVPEDFERPAEWIEIDEFGLPERRYRNAWVIDGDSVIVDQEKKAAIDAEAAKQEAIDRFKETFSVDDQLSLIWNALEAIARGEAMPESVTEVLQIRNTIKNST